MSGLLDDLNEAQRSAVTHPSVPLLVLAGPGTGKTRVITRRIVYALSERGIAPQRLMAVTFTNRAASEMRARVQALVDAAPVRIGTLHWAGNALLRRSIDRLGYRRNFTLLSSSQARNVLRGVATAPEMDRAISALKNGVELGQVARTYSLPPQFLRATLEHYQHTLHRHNAVDVDDLLFLAVRLLEEQEEVRRYCRGAYDEILVDEFQDVNPIQHRFLHLLAPDGFTAVGDEDQAIYGWRFAQPRAILDFPNHFPSAEIITLEQTYRSTKHILRPAISLIAHNRDRFAKTLRTDNPAGDRPILYRADDEREEASWIASSIRTLLDGGTPGEEIAVLYRVNAQGRVLEEALVRAGIPYHLVSGARFYDLTEVRYTVALLRLALDSADDVAAEVLLAAVHGVGERRLEELRRRAAQEGGSLVDLIRTELPSFPGPVAGRLHDVAQMVLRLQDLRSGPLLPLVDVAVSLTLERMAGLPELQRAAAVENLGELRSVAQELSERGTLRGLLDRVALEQPAGHGTGVALMSLHASKGLEFDAVFLSGLEEGLLPHARALERGQVPEERRLCYVGMTRARHRLYLSHARTRLLGGRAMANPPSQFLAEMGPPNIQVVSSPRRAAKPRLYSVAPGERVHHARWGAGTVVAVEGRGRETLVTLALDTGERQRVQLLHAPLSRVEKDRVHSP